MPPLIILQACPRCGGPLYLDWHRDTGFLWACLNCGQDYYPESFSPRPVAPPTQEVVTAISMPLSDRSCNNGETDHRTLRW